MDQDEILLSIEGTLIYGVNHDLNRLQVYLEEYQKKLIFDLIFFEEIIDVDEE